MTEKKDEPRHYCSMPETVSRVFDSSVSVERARLIRNLDKKWVNGTKLRYWFFDRGHAKGSAAQMKIVRDGFDVWRQTGIGIQFEEVSDMGNAEIRIGFLKGDGAWSYVGRDVIDVPGTSERTMNFGWDLSKDRQGLDVAVHEIGHTLGFPHEHQNPFAGIEWDEEAVYRHFGGSPNNWDQSTTFHNVLRKLARGEVEGSKWDPDSVMHYDFPAGLILKPEKYRSGIQPAGGLSQMDIDQARILYPPLTDRDYVELVPFNSHLLQLQPGQQANLTLQPSLTREYTVQTFGGADTVMVLFEDRDGDLRYVTADDDSGTNLNARFTVRLFAGGRYVLRIRLYASVDAGEFAVMMW